MALTELYFRYSSMYDRTLALLAGGVISEQQIAEGFEFAKKYAVYWQEKNSIIFEYYKNIGLILPDFWFAYPVHSQPHTGLIPFDDPLTFFITKDFDKAGATIIHELCHNFFGYFANSKRAEKLWNPVTKMFVKEPIDVQQHILINALASGGYFQVFGETVAIDLIKHEMTFPSLTRSWQLLSDHVDNQLHLLRNPVNIIESLT